MTEEPPGYWFNCVEDAMKDFDVKNGEAWRKGGNRRLMMGAFSEISTGTIGLCPAFPTLPPFVWDLFPSSLVLTSLAAAVGRARGQGDEAPVPVYPQGGDFLLTGLGLITTERNEETQERSHSFYLVDRTGGFYTRRFMGELGGKAMTSRGWIDPEFTDEQACDAAEEHPCFHELHAALSAVLYTCLADPAVVGKMAENSLIAQVAEVMDAIQTASTFHPTHPARWN